MSQLSAVQINRARSLLQRLQHLEDLAVGQSQLSVLSNSPQDVFFRRARALESRVGRAELGSVLGACPKEVEELDSRLTLLEKGVIRINNPQCYSSAHVARVASALRQRGLEHSASFLRVPDASHYYQKMTLEERALLLGAPSSAHLCKTLLFSTSGGRFDDDENAVQDARPHDNDDEQYLLLVVPYNSKIDASKLRACLKSKGLLVSRKTSPCVASAGRAERVLGFPHNGVSVIGGASALANNIPIVFAEVITKLQPPSVFLGGGEPDVKLKVDDVGKLITATQAHVMDVTEPRGMDEVPVNESLAETDAVETSALSPGKGIASERKSNGKKRSGNEGSETSDNEDLGPSAKRPPTALIEFDDLDVRVGIIQSARRHPASEKLMCEVIDIGEPSGPRPIVSGIQAFYTPEELTGQRVCVVANLKAASLGGEKSDGMVLCASWEHGGKSFVKVVVPPAEAGIGERIAVGTSQPLKEPATSTAVKKKKIFESVAERLCLAMDGETVVWNNQPVGVLNGNQVLPCRVTQGMAGAKVS